MFKVTNDSMFKDDMQKYAMLTPPLVRRYAAA